MAKSKNLTAEQVSAFMEKVLSLSEGCIEITNALRGCRVDAVPEIYDYARSLVVLSRDLSDAALRMFNNHALQDKDAAIKAMRREINSADEAGK